VGRGTNGSNIGSFARLKPDGDFASLYRLDERRGVPLGQSDHRHDAALDVEPSE
jgi:hypothetical protein